MNRPQENVNKTNKVLLIGWDAADWKVITPLLENGQMPHLEGLINRGVMGNLRTLYPILSPMLWTSIATGKRAWKHGIHGFSEPDPNSGAIRPISSLGRKCKAIWNILNQNGLKSNVIGWWPSNPAEPINGVMVSDLVKDFNRSPSAPWPLPPGSVHPSRLREHVAPLRLHPLEIDGECLLPFVPLAAEIDQKKDQRLISLSKCLAECTTIHAVATGAMQLEPWDFMAIYYDAIDHFSHGFMRYHPPKLDWISDEDFRLYKDVVSAAYQYHDMMLGTLLQLAGEDTTVILMSDHGFHSDHLRPRKIPNAPAGPTAEHRQHGIVVMAGPQIKQDDLIFGANLLDIAPTILQMFGLPVGEDMDGTPIVTAFRESPRVRYIPSWEEVEGDDGRHPKEYQMPPIEGSEAIQQLVDLGYIESPDASQEEAVAKTTRELKYNLAVAYQGANHLPEAQEILETLWERWPNEHRFGVNMFHNSLKLKQVEKAREILETLKQRKASVVKGSQEKLERRLKKLKEKEVEPKDLPQSDQQELSRLRSMASTNQAAFVLMESCLLQSEGKHQKSLELLDTLRDVESHYAVDVLRYAGEAYLAMGKWGKAEKEFATLADLDRENPDARVGMARALLKQRKYLPALDQATAAIGLLYHQPRAHYLAGLALMKLRKYDDAEKFLLTSVAQNPVFPDAHDKLSELYNSPLFDSEKARHHGQLAKSSTERIESFFAEEPLPTVPQIRRQFQPSVSLEISELDSGTIAPQPLTEDTIVIVSGLPRSGTSMMMQMLVAGGLVPFVDQHRPADESNPRGYYEHAAAKRLHKDREWLGEACGKCVKIVAQLLPQLSRDYRYRIVFMERNIDDVIASQQKLLSRLGKTATSPSTLNEVFQKQLEQVRGLLESHNEIASVLTIGYEATLSNPIGTVATLNRFLGGGLNEDAMLHEVRPELRHETRLRR